MGSDKEDRTLTDQTRDHAMVDQAWQQDAVESHHDVQRYQSRSIEIYDDFIES